MPFFGIALSATRPSISCLQHHSPHSRNGTLPPSPIVTFAAPPPCLSFALQKTTLGIVKRHYTIARIKGGMKFTCTRCAHHVSTFDFDARDGNLRTQAATAINRHATSVHHEPVMFSSLDVQQRVWRS
jgi:hypothetical protein